MITGTLTYGPGLGDLTYSDYLNSIFLDSGGNFNFAMVGLVAVGGYLVYKAFFGSDVRERRTKKRIRYHEGEISRLRKSSRPKSKDGKSKGGKDDF